MQELYGILLGEKSIDPGIKQYLRILIHLNYLLLNFKFTKISDINK